MNPIEHVYDELGRRVRSYHQMDTIIDSNMYICKNDKRISNVLIQRYVISMRRRILLVARHF